MELAQLVEANSSPERFSVHAQSRVTPSMSAAIDAFAKKHSIPRSTAVRVLLLYALQQVAAED